jgi:hypothetical protein
MKSILVIIIFIFSSFSTFSGEVTGAGITIRDLLKNEGHGQNFLIKNDLKVTLGEVTGAGKVHIDDVHAFITKDSLLRGSDIISITFSKNSPGKILQDIESIKFSALELEVAKKEIRAIVHRK